MQKHIILKIVNKNKTLKEVEKNINRVSTPKSIHGSSKGSTHGLVISQSAKHQISIKNEL